MTNDKTGNINFNGDNGKTENIQINAGENNRTENIIIPASSGIAPKQPIAPGAVHDYLIGAVIDGYTVKSLLSDHSGEAEIYLAEKGSESAVIKYYNANMKPKEDVLKKIHNLDHPDIIKMHSYGHHGRRFFEIMEYAKGGTLSDKDETGSYKYLPVAEEKAVKIIAQMVNAFSYLHKNGIIHRDIKPANIFCRDCDADDIIVGDMGISSDLDVDGGMTKKFTSMLKWTTGYAAPELVAVSQGASGAQLLIGIEVDYYALGITVFELLTGIDPFAGRDAGHITRDTTEALIVADLLSRPEAVHFSPKMKKLIQGLLIVQHKNRWGYEQVSDWLAGKEVELKTSYPLKVFEPLRFGSKTLNSIEEVVAALDEDRETAKSMLMRGSIPIWAPKILNNETCEAIYAIKDSSLDNDKKIGALIYLLDPNFPCKIDNAISIRTVDEFIELLRKKPGTMSSLILEEKKSDLYAFLNNIDKDLAALTEKMAANYKKEGEVSKRLSIPSNIYISLSGNSIMPFADDDYVITDVNSLLNIPVEYRLKAVLELTNKNSILYIWLKSQNIPGKFEADWEIMDKTWENLSGIVSGNIEYIRKEQKKKSERVPNRLRKMTLFAGAASLVTLTVFCAIMIHLLSGLFALPLFSPLAGSPVPKSWGIIYQENSISSKKVYAPGYIIAFNPKISEKTFSSLGNEDMIPVSYFSAGAGQNGYMMKKHFDTSFTSFTPLFIAAPLFILCLISLGGISILLINRRPDNFFIRNNYLFAASGIFGTLGCGIFFIIPMLFFAGKWNIEKKKSDAFIAKIKPGSASGIPKTQKNTAAGVTSIAQRQIQTINFTSGDSYTGECRNGDPDGRGVFTFSNGNQYDGELKDGLFHGKGKLTFNDGAAYTGDFRDGRFNGNGIHTFSDGGRYEGEFKDGQFNGRGKHIFSEGATYEGVFKDGRFEGRGVHTFSNGDQYDGEFQNGDFNGLGIFTFVDGNRYEGDFKDDQYHGHGVLTFDDGAVYAGEFKDGQFHGQGKMTQTDGTVLEGKWEDSEFIE